MFLLPLHEAKIIKLFEIFPRFHEESKNQMIEECNKFYEYALLCLVAGKIISWHLLMGHGVGPYIGLNEIGSQSLMINFITISYL